MNGYYRIDKARYMEGLFELWESKVFGDEAPTKVTLNGVEVGETWDSLAVFYNEYYENW